MNPSGIGDRGGSPTWASHPTHHIEQALLQDVGLLSGLLQAALLRQEGPEMARLFQRVGGLADEGDEAVAPPLSELDACSASTLVQGGWLARRRDGSPPPAPPARRSPRR